MSKRTWIRQASPWVRVPLAIAIVLAEGYAAAAFVFLDFGWVRPWEWGLEERAFFILSIVLLGGAGATFGIISCIPTIEDK